MGIKNFLFNIHCKKLQHVLQQQNEITFLIFGCGEVYIYIYITEMFQLNLCFREAELLVQLYHGNLTMGSNVPQ